MVNFHSTIQIYISLYEIIKFWIEWLNFHYYIMLSWAHLNQRRNWIFLCGKCPLSVCPSVRPRPYIFNFSHFLFLQPPNLRPQLFLYESLRSVVSFYAIWNPKWLSWPLIDRNIFDFFSRTAACEVGRLAENVSLGVSGSVVVYSNRFEIQHGCPSFWLAETFLLFSKTTSFELTRIAIDALQGVLKKCCCFFERFEIQGGDPVLWWVETFFFSSFPEKRHATLTYIPPMFLLGFQCLFLWRKTTYYSYIVINFITWIQLYEER